MLGYRNLVCGCVPHAWGAFAPAKGSLNNMKAIIPAAGLGTRFLPGTKCTPKEMLPVLDKPVIQYVVEEALDPEEVDDAIIVTSPGKPELLNYFQPDRSLENLLRERGKNAYADAVAHAGGMPVDFRYQYEPKGLGHAIRSAADAVAGENFLVLLGDYVVPNRDICDKMLAVSKEHGGASVIAVAACSPEEVSRYGVIAGERVGSLEGAEDVADAEPGAVWRIGGLVEKPAPEAAPSNLYIVGRYLLSPLVMDLLADQQAGKGGEIQLTDAMARSLDREAMYAVVIDPLSGYDTGTPSGWMATNALMAASDPRFASAFWGIDIYGCGLRSAPVFYKSCDCWLSVHRKYMNRCSIHIHLPACFLPKNFATPKTQSRQGFSCPTVGT